MTGSAHEHGAQAPITAGTRALLLLVVAAALLAGLFGRFKGIGAWPFGVDEFYLSRSIDNVLRSGLPAFPCGGYYNRGLIFQYVVAALRIGGWSPEFAGRFVAGVSSLAVLPAAYLLAKRLQGSFAGWLVVVVLSVSIWEIEMARFARMYAPFQAVFAWYLLAYLRYTVDAHASALKWMVALSVLGVLIWEGGALLGAANLFAIVLKARDGRFDSKDWRRVLLLGALLVLMYLATRDLRGFHAFPATTSGLPEEPRGALAALRAWFAPLVRHPAWAPGLLLPCALVALASRWIGSYRNRWLAFGGLWLALCAAAVHAFTVSVALLVLLPLIRLLDWRELRSRQARFFHGALGAFLLFWLACEALGATSGAPAFSIIQHLFGFPDVYDQVLRPWGRTLPILTLGIGAALLYTGWICIAAERKAPDPVSVLLSLSIVMVLAVGATPTDRIETRYTFFLYPVLIVLAVCALLSFARRHAMLRNIPVPILGGIVLACFAATEDFQPQHLRDVDSARITFRVGMSAIRTDHYYPRGDIRGVAEWLQAHVRPGDVVITGNPTLDEYYRHIDYFYLDDTDGRYETYVCPNGRTERWTNHPVLYTEAALKPLIASGHRIFANLYGADEQGMMSYAPSAAWSVKRVWRADAGYPDVILIEGRPGAAGER